MSKRRIYLGSIEVVRGEYIGYNSYLPHDYLKSLMENGRVWHLLYHHTLAVF